MKNLNFEQIRAASFPDAPVSHFELESEKRRLRFVTDTFVGSAPDGRWFDESIVTISDFESVKIVEEESIEIPEFSSDLALREICEFIVANDRIILRGFSQGPGLWTEYTLEKPKIQIEYDDTHQES